jgi:hypothetical protein
MGDGSPMGEIRQGKYFCLKIFFLLSFHQIFALPPSTTGLFAAMFSLLLSLHTYVPSFTHTSYSSTLKMDAACSS